MKKLHLFSLLWFVTIAAPLVHGQSQNITFEQKQWDVSNAEVELAKHLNREAMLIKSGTVFLDGETFQDGIIETDIAAVPRLIFGGVVFRGESVNNLEEVYLRLNKSGLPDAVQYTPRYNNISGWQLYNGEGYTTAVPFPTAGWIHLKVVFKGRKAEIFVGDGEKPALLSRLNRPVASGRIGLWGLFGAYISHFKYTPTEAYKPEPTTPTEPASSFITDWQLSPVFSADSVDTEIYPSEAKLHSPGWSPATYESSGLINISKTRHIADAGGGDAVIFARTVINSDQKERKKLTFGYSDEISIFLNEEIIFSGNSRWRSRDLLFNGIVGLHDHVYLDLNKGENELLFVITEWFGGWGFISKLEDK